MSPILTFEPTTAAGIDLGTGAGPLRSEGTASEQGSLRESCIHVFL